MTWTLLNMDYIQLIYTCEYSKCPLETLFWLNNTILKPKLITIPIIKTLIFDIYFGAQKNPLATKPKELVAKWLLKEKFNLEGWLRTCLFV